MCVCVCVCVRLCVCVCVCVCVHIFKHLGRGNPSPIRYACAFMCMSAVHGPWTVEIKYGVAMTSRLLTIICFFCKRDL